MTFEELYRASVRFRRASRELEGLLRQVFVSLGEGDGLDRALEALLAFLSSDAGRTDANCSTTFHFIAATEELWRTVPDPLHSILDDMSGTLHESIYAPDIARTFEATPEQLLERLRKT